MKATGIQRRVDELGRIVLPVELRRALEIDMDQHDCIVLKPHRDSCGCCGGTKDISAFRDKNICGKCLRELHRR